MTLSEIKNLLFQVQEITFELPNGSQIPNHFHITEVGKVTKNYIDCGGVLRREELISMQLWEANDYDHRITPNKFIDIITLSENIFDLKDKEIEIEYQGKTTINKYGLDFNGRSFVLTSKTTDCLAKDKCGITPVIQEEKYCTPGSGCC